MTSRYFKDLDEYAECDVIIAGAGSAGLSCAYELSKHPDVKARILSLRNVTGPVSDRPARAPCSHAICLGRTGAVVELWGGSCLHRQEVCMSVLHGRRSPSSMSSNGDVSTIPMHIFAQVNISEQGIGAG